MGLSWAFSFQLASLMTARGLIALIALDVALQVGAFTSEVYWNFVIMALVTTMMAGPLFAMSYDPKADAAQEIVKKHETPEAGPVNAETPMQAERKVRRHSSGDLAASNRDPEVSLLTGHAKMKQDINFVMLKNLVTEIGSIHDRWSIILDSAEVLEGELRSVRNARELASSNADTVVPNVAKENRQVLAIILEKHESSPQSPQSDSENIELGIMKPKF
jgi:hypothetical protein